MDSKKDTISEERTCLKEQVFSVLAEIQEQNHSHEV
jgi:hypothetical protein